jgi:hypothetical protein
VVPLNKWAVLLLQIEWAWVVPLKEWGLLMLWGVGHGERQQMSRLEECHRGSRHGGFYM